MRKFKYLTILLLLLAVYACKDDMEYEWRKESNEKSLPVAVQEARSYFEKYAAEVELSDQILGLSPGNFAPDWSKSVVTTDGASYVCVNVPIVSEIVYEGSFASRYDSIKGASDESYRTAIGQKMIVVKDPATGHFGCYIVTIIPDEKNAVKSGDKAIGMYHNGDPNTKFSGTALFSMLGSKAYSVAAGRYKDGERYAAASWWWNTSGNTKQLEEEITELVGLKRLSARTKTMTKEDGDMFGYVIVPGGIQIITGGGSGGSDGGSSGSSAESYLAYAWVVTSSQTNQNNSNYTNNSSDSGSTYSGYIADAGGNTTSPAGYSGTSTTTSSSTQSSPTPRDYVKTVGDKFYNGTTITSANYNNFSLPPGMGQTQKDFATCVPRIMAYANKLFGGRKTHQEFITYINNYHNIEVRDIGVPLNIMKHHQTIPPHFVIDASLVNYVYSSIIEWEENGRKVPMVVMTTIPLPSELLPDFVANHCEPGAVLLPNGAIQYPGGTIFRPVHAILVVGCKANGDVIYMDSMKNKLQEVDPQYLYDSPTHYYKFVITGIR